MKKMFNEGNQILNLMSSSGSGTVINYFRFRLFNKLRFRFHLSKSYGSYGSGSGSTTLQKSTGSWIRNTGQTWNKRISKEDYGMLFVRWNFFNSHLPDRVAYAKL